MNSYLFYIFCFVLLIVLELLYFKIAIRYQIIDQPNHRSSHNYITIRGAGILFSFAVIIFYFFSFQYFWFLVGLILISIISFLDDLKPISFWLRLVVHFTAIFFIFYQLQSDSYWLLNDWPILLTSLAFIIAAYIKETLT